MSPAEGQYLIFCLGLILFSLMSGAVIYLRVSKDRRELEREHAEKKAYIVRVSSTQQDDNRDNIFFPKQKGHNTLGTGVSTDAEHAVRSALEEARRYSKRLEKNNFGE
jgi:hypothetical protein